MGQPTGAKEELMEIATLNVELAVADGSKMQAYVARPAGGKSHPGLLVFQEAFGVNAHIRDVTERFARAGYVAIAPELFHRSAPAGFEGAYDNFPGVMPHMQAITEAGLGADAGAALAWLQSKDGAPGEPVASVGYCMGGRVSFLANSRLPLKAAVSYYGGGIAPGPRGPGLLDRAAALHAPMLLFWGLLDQHIGVEAPRIVADALRQAGKVFANVEFSDADHGFFCDARPSYNAGASSQAWALTLEFLRVHLSK
jgi:carboxymethylenebutenolidase